MEKSLKYGKYTIEINYGFDEIEDNPRSWAQGILYGLDKSIEEFNDHKEEIKKEFYVFPVYKYEHGMVPFPIGNTTFPTRDFDSGLYGLYAVPKLNGMDKEQAEKMAENELYEWECYCNGTLYEYHIFDDDLMIDEYNSGYFNEDDCIEDALEVAKYYTEMDEKDAVTFWANNND